MNTVLHIRKDNPFFSAANIIQALWPESSFSDSHSTFPIGNNILGKSFNLVRPEQSLGISLYPRLGNTI